MFMNLYLYVNIYIYEPIVYVNVFKLLFIYIYENFPEKDGSLPYNDQFHQHHYISQGIKLCGRNFLFFSA